MGNMVLELWGSAYLDLGKDPRPHLGLCILLTLPGSPDKPGKQVPAVEDRKEPSGAKAVAYFPELWQLS